MAHIIYDNFVLEKVSSAKKPVILILNKMSKNYKRFDIVVVKAGGSKIIKSYSCFK